MRGKRGARSKAGQGEQAAGGDTSAVDRAAQELRHLLECNDADFVGGSEDPSEGMAGSLVSRLGKGQRKRRGDIKGVFSFSKEFLHTLRSCQFADPMVAAFTETIGGQVRDQAAAEKSILGPSLSAVRVDKLFTKLYGSPLSDDPAEQFLIPSRIVDGMLSRMEEDDGFFPAQAFGVLLKRGCVSDAAHPSLHKRIIATGSFEALSEYVNGALDMQEATMYKLLEHTLSTTAAWPGLVPIAPFTAQETALLSLLAWEFNADDMTPALRKLPAEYFAHLFGLLEGMVTEYSLTHATRFLSTPSKLPERDNVLKWLGACIDAHHPTIMQTPALLESVRRISALVTGECRVTERLGAVGAMLDGLASAAKRLRGSAKHRSSAQPQHTDYVVEVATF